MWGGGTIFTGKIEIIRTLSNLAALRANKHIKRKGKTSQQVLNRIPAIKMKVGTLLHIIN